MLPVPTPGLVIDLAKLFERSFGGKPYVVPGVTPDNTTQDGVQYRIPTADADQLSTPNGSLIAEQVNGIEIWLPTKLYYPGQLYVSLPYSVVKISGKKTIVKTAMVERKGTVKEQYAIEDYDISLKGFLIGDNRQFPENHMTDLKNLYEAQAALTMDNAITNIFLTDRTLQSSQQRRVVIEDLDFPEVSGGRKHVRPFTMKLCSDTVFTLEIV